MSEHGDSHCFSRTLFAVNVGVALFHGVIAFLSFFQLLRIHMRNVQLHWTRQKVISFIRYCHLLLLAVDGRFGPTLVVLSLWLSPKYFFLQHFFFFYPSGLTYAISQMMTMTMKEVFVRKTSNELANIDNHRKCFPVRFSRVGNRQKIVILVAMLSFITMMAFAVIIWIGLGQNPIDSEVAVEVYLDLSAIVMLLLGGGLACYGTLLYLKMSKVRAEKPSSEMWKVAGLTIVSVLCFTSSSCVELLTDIPMLHDWHQYRLNDVYTSFLLILYYFVGSSIPSALVLWVMRELPPAESDSMQEESSTIAFVADSSVAIHHPQRWITATSMQNQEFVHPIGIYSEYVQSRSRAERKRCSSMQRARDLRFPLSINDDVEDESEQIFLEDLK
ncbi:hypothetical protein Lal_00008181, partial [Lupinus albus]